MEEGHECAGACVDDDVGLGRLAGTLAKRKPRLIVESMRSIVMGQFDPSAQVHTGDPFHD